MANVRTAQAPARSGMGLAAVCTLVAILSAELVVAPGFAWAAEAAGGAGLPQSSLSPPPVMSNALTTKHVSDASSISRWTLVPAWQKVLGVGATLVGLAAVGAGAYLLWRDGQYGCWPAPCKSAQFHTALAGWLLVAGGAAVSLGGVTFLLLPPIGEPGGRALAGLAVSAKF